MTKEAVADFFTRAVFAAFDEEASARTRMFVVSIWFQGCLMIEPSDVEAAFHVLRQKVRGCLTVAHQPRAAILTDIYSLAMVEPVRPVWGRALRAFLDEYCLQLSPGQHLVARFNHAPVFSTGTTPMVVEAFKRVIAEQGQLAGFQPNVAESREEALAMLLKLRVQASSQSSPGNDATRPL